MIYLGGEIFCVSNLTKFMLDLVGVELGFEQNPDKCTAKLLEIFAIGYFISSSISEEIRSPLT